MKARLIRLTIIETPKHPVYYPGTDLLVDPEEVQVPGYGARPAFRVQADLLIEDEATASLTLKTVEFEIVSLTPALARVLEELERELLPCCLEALEKERQAEQASLRMAFRGFRERSQACAKADKVKFRSARPTQDSG